MGLGAGELIEIGDERCILSVIADITDRKRAEEALSGMNRKLIEAQEQERTRIARDLHDDVTQRLALLAIDLDQVQGHLPDSDFELRTRVGTIRERAAQIAADVQTMSHELHSSRLEYLGLFAAVKGSAKSLASCRTRKLTLKAAICQLRCRRRFRSASSEFYRKPCTMPRNTVEYGTLKCNC